MDLESSIILLIMILLCVIPIMIINKKKRTKERQFLQTLFDLAAKNSCKISDYDKWDQTAIGIDSMTHKLFFVRKTTETETAKEVILTEMKKCRFIDTNRVVNNGASSQKITEKLELAFTEWDHQNPELILELYNSNYDSLDLRDEIKLACKWSAIANSEIAIVAAGK